MSYRSRKNVNSTTHVRVITTYSPIVVHRLDGRPDGPVQPCWPHPPQRGRPDPPSIFENPLNVIETAPVIDWLSSPRHFLEACCAGHHNGSNDTATIIVGVVGGASYNDRAEPAGYVGKRREVQEGRHDQSSGRERDDDLVHRIESTRPPRRRRRCPRGRKRRDGDGCGGEESTGAGEVEGVENDVERVAVRKSTRTRRGWPGIFVVFSLLEGEEKEHGFRGVVTTAQKT